MRASLLLLGLSLSLVFFTGCDSVGTDDPTTCHSCHPGDGDGDGDGGDGGSSDATFIPVDPRQTYLRTSHDAAIDAPAIRLSDHDAEPGERVCGVAVGDFDTGGGSLVRSNGGPLITAVFSSDSQLLGSSHLNRVPGAIDAGDDARTPDTVIDGLPTDIAEDFDASNACVTIPAGAAFVFFSAYDGFFADNVDATPGGQPFGIEVHGKN